jgi:methylglutaconyl-CoA hydratase
MEEEVLFSIDNKGIAKVTLNRPHLHNAMGSHMVRKLNDHFKKLHKMDDVRAVVLTGEGGSFCSGADLSWMKKSSTLSEKDNYDEALALSEMLYNLETLPMPTIAYVQGVVMGGGLGLIACCDIVLSDFHTIFCFPEVKLGIVPAVISPYIIRSVSSRFARRFFLTGEKFNASVAGNMGLVHTIVELEQVQAEIEALINNILKGGPHAVRMAKKLIRDISGDVPKDIRLMTAKLISDARTLDEGQEGIAAYLDKVYPKWVPR